MAETSNSAPFLSFDYEDKKCSNVSLSVSTLVPSVAEIRPSFFNKLTINLSLSNRAMIEIIQCSLAQKCSAIFSVSPYFADIVISEKQIKIPPMPNSRGKKIAKSLKKPRVILLEQIPWVFEPIITAKNIFSKNENLISEEKADMIVVGDTRHQYRPNMKQVSIPELQIPKKKLNNYSLSPFTPIPVNYESVMGKVQAIQNARDLPQDPPAHGYCELCQTCYDDPVQHHTSLAHKRNSDMFRWMEFDQLSRSIQSI